MSLRIITPDELKTPDTPALARQLLGAYLCHETSEGVSRSLLTELEAYDGPDDRACHAYKGKTPRNEVLFGQPGYWYVYLCYGVHWLLNIVTGPENYPAAILIRGVDDTFGPGRVTKKLGLHKVYNRLPATPVSRLWLEWGDQRVDDAEVLRLPRVGIGYAGEEWAAKPYRFVWNRPPDNEKRPSTA